MNIFRDIRRGVRGATREVKHTAETVGGEIKHKAEDVGRKTKHTAEDAGSSFKDFTGKVERGVQDAEREVKHGVKDIEGKVKKGGEYLYKEVEKEVKEFIEKNPKIIVDALKKYFLDVMVDEIEDFAKNRAFSVGRAVTSNLLAINRMVPIVSQSFTGGVAGSAIQLDYAGQEHAKKALKEINNSIKDNKVTTKELKRIIEATAPDTISITMGGTVVFALVGGTEVNTSSTSVIHSRDIPEFVKNLPAIVERAFITMPTEAIKGFFK